MVTKRIIPCLDIKGGMTVKGVNFLELKYAGDPIILAKKYSDEGADELVFLDISATNEERKTLKNLVKEIAKVINIPFTVGGGINTINDVEILLENGVDKISINSGAIKNPNLIYEMAKKFGSQCVVVAIDAKLVGNNYNVFINGGKKETDKKLLIWAKEVENLGTGEILYTCMDTDGTKNGFDIENLKWLGNNLKIPVIASGGCGTKEHFLDLFKNTNVDAGLAASVFHFGEIQIKELKIYLLQNGINIRLK